MEQPNSERLENAEEAVKAAEAEGSGQKQEGEGLGNDLMSASSALLMSFSEGATEEEKIIMEQMAATKREPRVTAIGKRSSPTMGLALILCAVPLLWGGFLFIPGALPLLVAGAVMLVLMGAWRIINRKKRPCICPYCAYFDDIPDEIVHYHCPRCQSESLRVGDSLHPKRDQRPD